MRWSIAWERMNAGHRVCPSVSFCSDAGLAAGLIELYHTLMEIDGTVSNSNVTCAMLLGPEVWEMECDGAICHPKQRCAPT